MSIYLQDDDENEGLEVFCPYCGKENVQATQHVQDMERYHGEFESTKSHVYGKTKSVASNAVKGVVISLLFLVIAFGNYSSLSLKVR